MSVKRVPIPVRNYDGRQSCSFVCWKGDEMHEARIETHDTFRLYTYPACNCFWWTKPELKWWKVFEKKFLSSYGLRADLKYYQNPSCFLILHPKYKSKASNIGRIDCLCHSQCVWIHNRERGDKLIFSSQEGGKESVASPKLTIRGM